MPTSKPSGPINIDYINIDYNIDYKGHLLELRGCPRREGPQDAQDHARGRPLDQSPAIALSGKSMQYLDAAMLLRARVQLLRLAGRPKGLPDPTAPLGRSVTVVDLSTPSHHRRTMRYAPTAQPTVLVETVCARPQLVESIGLLDHDANFRLMRYGLPTD